MFLDFLFARHRSTYIWLAIKYCSTPWHVYNIAHGADISRRKDRKIAHELLARKIVHRHRHSSNPDDYDM